MKQYRLIQIDLGNADFFYPQLISFQSEGGFVNRLAGMSREDLKGWLVDQNQPAQDRLVPQNLYVLSDGEKVYGIGTLYRQLNEALSQAGGHISYRIAPQYRGKRLAHLLLHLLLDEAKKLGIERPLLTIFDHNIHSRRVAEKAGGILVRRAPGWLYYEMDVSPVRMDNRILKDLERRFKLRVLGAEPVLGGGVNTKWSISTDRGRFFVKQYSAQRYPAEKLQRVKETLNGQRKPRLSAQGAYPLIEGGQAVFNAGRQINYSVFCLDNSSLKSGKAATDLSIVSQASKLASRPFFDNRLTGY